MFTGRIIACILHACMHACGRLCMGSLKSCSPIGQAVPSKRCPGIILHRTGNYDLHVVRVRTTRPMYVSKRSSLCTRHPRRESAARAAVGAGSIRQERSKVSPPPAPRLCRSGIHACSTLIFFDLLCGISVLAAGAAAVQEIATAGALSPAPALRPSAAADLPT